MSGFKEVEGPDGAVIEFPADMSDDQILSVMRRQYPPTIDPKTIGTDYKAARQAIDALPEFARDKATEDYAKYYVEQERKDGGIGQAINDHVRMFARNIPIVGEWADEANAATSAALGGDYSLSLAAEHARREAIDREKRAGVETGFGRVDTGDIAKTAGFVGGAVAAPMARVFQSGSASATAGNAALTGAIYAGGEAAGTSKGGAEEKLGAALAAAPSGAALGGAMGAAGHRIGQWASRPRYGEAGQEAVPSDAFRDYARGLYQEADNAGAIMSGTRRGASGMTFAEDLLDRVRTSLGDDAYVRTGDRPINPILQEINALNGQNTTFKGLDRIRSMARKVSREKDGDREGYLAGRLTDSIDDAIANIDPAHLVQGNLPRAVEATREAARAWRLGVKTEMIEDAIEAAQRRASASGSGGNLDNTMRQEFGKIVSNPKKAAQFTDNEVGAMRQVIEGTGTRNALRLAGKLSPSGNGMMLGMHGIMSSVAGIGPVLASAGAGWVSKGLATRGTRRAAERVLAGVSNNNMPMSYSRFQRAAQMLRDGRIDRAAFKMATQIAASELAKETDSDKDQVFNMMYADALKAQNARNTRAALNRSGTGE